MSARPDNRFALWWMAQKRKSLEQLQRETEALRKLRESLPDTANDEQ